MPSLTVTEKEHWKNRIGKRLDRKIEAIAANAPGVLDRIRQQARQQALQSLGLAAMQAELDTVAAQAKELEQRAQRAHQAMLATLRRVPVEEIQEPYYGSPYQEVIQAVQKRQAVHEEELLAEDEDVREILRLRREKENLLDTVWLATSPAQIRQLWQKVFELLGEEQTPLQKQALAIEAAGIGGTG